MAAEDLLALSTALFANNPAAAAAAVGACVKRLVQAEMVIFALGP